MKKQLTTSLILLVCLGVGLYFFFSSNNNKQSELEARNFKIENINSIDKIFLSDKKGTQVTLIKEADVWRVNNQYVARNLRIQTLLNTAKNIEVKQRVPLKQRERIFKNLSTNNIKAEFFTDNDLVKSYFVGTADGTTTGTYMLLINEATGENYSLPFITHLLGFEGYLTPRYEPDPSTWRDLKIFYYPKNAIEKVKLEYPQSPENNFEIKLEDESYNLYHNGTQISVNSNKVKKYLLNFKSVAAERLVKNDSISNSISKSSPWFTLTVTNLLGTENKIIGYKRRMPAGSKNSIGLPLLLDPDRFYGRIYENELGVLQHYVFEPILQKKSDLE